MADSDTPKIIVDSDWKSQARAEKEKLAAAEKQKAAEKAKAAEEAGVNPSDMPDGGPEGMPPADFGSLLATLVTQALMYLGGFPDPQTGRAVVSLEHAKFHIDLLAIFQEKTKGNLTEAEAADLTQAISQLRLRFVEITKAIAQMAAERRAGKGPGGPQGPGAQAGPMNFGMPQGPLMY